MNAIVLVALKRPYTFIVLAILILIFGGRAALRTPTDIFPNIESPSSRPSGPITVSRARTCRDASFITTNAR
jgi:hypothetical protein